MYVVQVCSTIEKYLKWFLFLLHEDGVTAAMTRDKLKNGCVIGTLLHRCA